MKIAVSAESTIDLTPEILKEFDIKIVPFTVNLGDKAYLDGEITSDEIIKYVADTGILPKTSAVNQFQYDEHFENLLKEYDAVIHFTLSSELSCANQNANNSAKQFSNVYVIDTRSLSTGIALLALYACDLVKEGVEPEEIYNRCLKRVDSVQASFALKRLDFLYKGGRCSALSYFGANLLKIRPQILVEDGKMRSGKKYRGNYEYVIKQYISDIFNEFTTPDLKRVFLTYTTANESVINYAVGALKDRGFEKVYITRAGGTITSHCGEDCLGILYINDGANN